MTPEERLYQEGLEALKQRDFPLARDMFTRLLKLNRQNPEYWIAMSAAVETIKERGVCLKEALKFDPQNHLAIRGLRLIGEDIEDPVPDWKISQVVTDWKTSLELKREARVQPKVPRKRAAGLVFLGMIVFGLIVGSIYLAQQNRYSPDQSTILRVSLTPSPSITITPTNAPTTEGVQLLNTNLSATFTPTPLYAATPHNRSEAYSTALKAYANKDWGRAVEFLKQVIQEEPGSADLHYLLGEIYRQQGNGKEAAAAYDAAIKANSAYAPAYLGKGRLALQTNPANTDVPLGYFLKAIEMDPNLHEAMLELANIYLVKGGSENALLWLERYAQAAPESALVEFTRARISLLLGDNDAALTAVEKSRAMDISYLPVYKLWGEILQVNGRYEDSAAPLLTYLHDNPLDSEAQLLMANAYFHLGDYDKALDTINEVISVNNKVENAYLLRGDIYMVQGKPDDADKSYTTALQLNYRSFGGLIGKARVLLSETFAGAAYNYIERAIDAADTPQEEAIALYWRAVTLVGLNEMSAARRDYETFLALPRAEVPEDLRAQALAEYLRIVTPTPSPTATITRTPGTVQTFTATPNK
jgi:tetratricopeptide (TPR) repeat protein